MSNFVEIKGKTIEDAILNAEKKFNVLRDDLEYNIVEKGSTGILGFIGVKPAIISVRVKEKVIDIKDEIEINTNIIENKKLNFDNPKEEVKQYLKEVFSLMDVDVSIDNIKYDENSKILNVELNGTNMGILIGQRGQTLESIQLLLNLAINKNKSKENHIKVRIDTENYRERRKETLERLAYSVAKKVKYERNTIKLEPMTSYERRIIHSALQNNKYVVTKSEGEEPNRRIVVMLKK